MIIAGLDEAALGPSLGPFCACVTRFRIETNRTPPIPLSRTLASAVSDRVGDRSRISVGDSKYLYRSGKKISALEEGVLAFLEVSGSPKPEHFSSLIEILAGRDALAALEQTPWFEKAGEMRLPLSPELSSSETEQKTEALRSLLKSSGITVLPPLARFVPAAGFNREIISADGKGRAVRNLISRLMKTVFDNREEPVCFTVDRQGGRRYYSEWLAELAPGTSLSATEEGPKRSAYRMGNLSVEFLVKADASCLEVALASMFSKYLREGAMRLFNDWWAERLPGIRPTAGYPQDAKRFIAEVEKAGALPADRNQLIRLL